MPTHQDLHPLTVASLWAFHRAREVPSDTPAAVVEERRRDFYAGAAALLSGMLDLVDDPDGDPDRGPTARELDDIERIAEELADFAPDGGPGPD
jgi:hypothetical protein